MHPSRYRVVPGERVNLSALDSSDRGEFKRRQDAEEEIASDLQRLNDALERMYVDRRHAVLLVLQGMDTAGKDGMIRHLSGGINLLASEVTSFKRPSGEESDHDYLWRVHNRIPRLGTIGIFNRSHYEDVLVPRVHRLVEPRVWKQRYRQINDFERMLAENQVVVLKFFLHISRDEQRQRLQERLDDRQKLWKFDPADVQERAHWDGYQQAYEALLSSCSTQPAPWHVVPSDHKWFRNYVITRLLVETLDTLDLHLPEQTFDPDTIKLS